MDKISFDIKWIRFQFQLMYFRHVSDTILYLLLSDGTIKVLKAFSDTTTDGVSPLFNTGR